MQANCGQGALITGGVCLSYWLDFGFSFLDPSTIAWRFPIAFQIFFALIILALILELPESPRWLILKGRAIIYASPTVSPIETDWLAGKEDEAIIVLGALSDLPTEDSYIQSEFSAIKDTVLEMSKGSFADLFTMTEDRHLQRTEMIHYHYRMVEI